MTVEELLVTEGSNNYYVTVDEEISVLKRYVGSEEVSPSSAASLIQRSYRFFNEKRIVKAVLLIQQSVRMLKSRQTTLRLVRDGQDSPLVTLRGKYLCGNPSPLPADEINPEKGHETIISSATEFPSRIPRRTSKRTMAPVESPKVAKLNTVKDPLLLDESGLPLSIPHLNRLTLDNTKRNSLYTTCRIKVEEVVLGVPRPGSPPRAWSKKPVTKEICLTDHEDNGDAPLDEDEEARIRWNKKLIFMDELDPKAPLDNEVILPIKPILKKNSLSRTVERKLPEEAQEVLVKKVVWLDDQLIDYSVEDILEGAPPVAKAASKGRKGTGKKQKSPTVKGQPERVKKSKQRK